MCASNIHSYLLQKLLRYLCDEKKNKHNEELDTSEWIFKTPKNIPRQRNGNGIAFPSIALRGEFLLDTDPS